MSARLFFRSVLQLAIAVMPAPLLAQSMTVLGSGEDARRCSIAAELAASMRIASRSDLEDCNQAIELGALRRDDRAGTFVNRGIIAGALGDNAAALADYDRALALLPELPEAYVGRGNIRFIENDIPGAIAEYDRALGMTMNRRHVALLNRGMALEARGDLDAAERDYREALQLRPEWPLALSRIERVEKRRQAAKTPPPAGAP